MSQKILAVDDNECMRELLSLHLRLAGYSVQVAEDGIAAGHAVLKSAPDLIICDIDMPHMDGFEFIAALKADSTLPRIPVIFLTSMDDGHDRSAQLGACEYLMKPLRADQLLAAVARHLPHRRPSHPSGRFTAELRPSL